jgi:hypothetical protein
MKERKGINKTKSEKRGVRGRTDDRCDVIAHSFLGGDKQTNKRD